jgi:predicted Fe-Mo cluster-binding NifX family protein
VSKIRQLFAVLMLLLPSIGLTEENVVAQKFAIAADGVQVTSEIAKLAGVAPYFHLYDSHGNLLEVLPNPHLDLEFGVGPACAATLADKGVTVLVARQVPGPKMLDVLEARNVRVVRRTGTVEDVAKELKE